MKKIVVLAGEGEYESNVTMLGVRDRLAKLPSVDVAYLTPDVLADWPDYPESSFGGLDLLAGADLLVLYTRFRVLPDREVSQIAAYLAHGGSLLALRTSSHAFHPVAGSAWFDWTERFGQDILGSGWTRHHGHTSTTDVTRVSAHPIVAGVPQSFHVDSWLYETDPPADSEILLWGEPVNPEGEAVPSPVAWTRQVGQQRIFYTSLGSQSDLKREDVLSVIENAARWCLRMPGGDPV